MLRDCPGWRGAEADADAWLQDALARALEANERWEQLAADCREETPAAGGERAAPGGKCQARERDAQREAELERVNAALAVLQRLVFGRSSERARPEAAARDEDGGGRGPGPGGRR